MVYSKPTYENEVVDCRDVILISKIGFDNGVTLVEKKKDEAQVEVNVLDLLGWR